MRHRLTWKLLDSGVMLWAFRIFIKPSPSTVRWFSPRLVFDRWLLKAAASRHMPVQARVGPGRSPCSMVCLIDLPTIASAGSCRLDMVLYSEEVRSAAQSALYPVNSLRNAALTQAQTEVWALGEHRRAARDTFGTALQSLPDWQCLPQ